jgi:competence protein ComEA
MKKVLLEYLSFNKSERRGLFVLLSLLILIIAANLMLPLFFTPEHYDFSAFQQEIIAFEKTRVKYENKWEKKTYEKHRFDYAYPEQSAEQSKLTPYPFDPNQMEETGWEKLGLTSKQVKMLQNFQRKGGKFRCKADFKKMYCISPQEYEVLEPFIQLPDTVVKSQNSFTSNLPWKEEEAISVEINTAQVEDLMKLKGIGEYFAKKIIAYRSSLGGFLRIEQLMEVPKMDSARYEQIRPNLTINPNAVRRKNVNTATFEELSSHPYIGYNIALSLTNYRDTHGRFTQLQDIKKSALVTDKVYQRISPYLRVD